MFYRAMIYPSRCSIGPGYTLYHPEGKRKSTVDPFKPHTLYLLCGAQLALLPARHPGPHLLSNRGLSCDWILPTLRPSGSHRGLPTLQLPLCAFEQRLSTCTTSLSDARFRLGIWLQLGRARKFQEI